MPELLPPSVGRELRGALIEPLWPQIEAELERRYQSFTDPRTGGFFGRQSIKKAHDAYFRGRSAIRWLLRTTIGDTPQGLPMSEVELERFAYPVLAAVGIDLDDLARRGAELLGETQVGLFGSDLTKIELDLDPIPTGIGTRLDEDLGGAITSGFDLAETITGGLEDVSSVVEGVTDLAQDLLPLVNLGLGIAKETGAIGGNSPAGTATTTSRRRRGLAGRLADLPSEQVGPFRSFTGAPAGAGASPVEAELANALVPFMAGAVGGAAGELAAGAGLESALSAVAQFLVQGGVLDEAGSVRQFLWDTLGNVDIYAWANQFVAERGGQVGPGTGGTMAAANCNLPAALMTGGGVAKIRPASQVSFISPTGQIVHYKNMGRPMLWSGDMAACKRVAKATGKVLRRRGSPR